MSYCIKVTIFWIGICCFYFNCDYVASLMTLDEKYILKNQAKEMFYHAYKAYMDHAYPADELMPLSCKGRYRDIEPNRGDVDDALGNFSLTLVDTLDTLVVLGDFDEFERAVKKVIKDVSFDNDVVVSVFETNIRMLGGLLSGHILGSYLQENFNRMKWYSGELLNMAKDLGYRLMPAFNTSTGVPHPRINLRYGLKSQKLGVVRETCTACAGTMILEFAALSRLTGESVFEEKARAAMDYLWQQRHRTSDLMGTVLNIHNGDWIRRDSGVGAGIDSYYEYCLKAYILLGDDVYLERFNKHYSAVMKYVSQGPLLVDVHMHRPHTNSRNFMDALLAFWPGLQVLKGDIKPAIETHEMLYQVMQRHNFLPEAFTTDFQVHWGQHPLRPEFVESTYFLYKATNDPYYLEVGKKVLHSLQTYARVPCGFAAVKDVRTGSHEDRMDSFVLAETLKYLYLLFANKDELTIEVDDFVFTTEAHLLPLSLARISNASLVDASPKAANMGESLAEDFAHSCPNNHYLFPNDGNFAQTIRVPLKNLVEEVCPSNKSPARTLLASEFYGGKRSHLEAVRKMGITVMKLADGVIQLVHNASMAESADRAEEGIMFMKEMMERTRDNPEEYVAVYYYVDQAHKKILPGCPAKFGVNLRRIGPIEGYVTIAKPVIACSPLTNPEEIQGKIAFVQRGRCMFIEKARHLQKAGAIAGIVIDDNPMSSVEKTRMFSMDGNDQDDVTIPLVFMFSKEANILLKRYRENPDTIYGVTDDSILEETEDDSSPPTEAKVPDPPSSKLSDVEFVDSKPSPKSLEPDEFITAQKPAKPTDPGFSAHRQVQQLLLQKLQHLQRIWSELDRLLSDHGRKEALRRVYHDSSYLAAFERLMRNWEDGAPDQDALRLISSLLDRAEPRSLSPSYSREAFIAFVSGEPYDCRPASRVLENAVRRTGAAVFEEPGS